MEEELISRAEIVSGVLARQRRARLLLQRLIESLDGSPAADAGDALTVQLQQIKSRAGQSRAVSAAGLLERSEQWLALIPGDRPLREELLRQIEQAYPCRPEQSASLARLLELSEPEPPRPPAPAVPLAAATPPRDRPQANRSRVLDPATWPVGIKLGGLMVLFSLVPGLLVGQVGALMAEREAEVSGQRQLAGLANSVARGLNPRSRATWS